ncbi:phage tail protein [Clostridia bacterium]|nr:phage tail protein [Clostridia bacterium]
MPVASREDPLASFRFIVEIQSDNGTKVVAAYSKFSGVKIKIDTVEARSGSDTRGVMDGVPALTHYENATLEQGVVGESSFVDWIYSVTPNGYTPPENDGIYRTVDITAVNSRGQRAITWSLFNAVPVAYELSPMDGMKNEILSESVEFAFSGFTRTVHAA